MIARSLIVWISENQKLKKEEQQVDFILITTPL